MKNRSTPLAPDRGIPEMSKFMQTPPVLALGVATWHVKRLEEESLTLRDLLHLRATELADISGLRVGVAMKVQRFLQDVRDAGDWPASPGSQPPTPKSFSASLDNISELDAVFQSPNALPRPA